MKLKKGRLSLLIASFLLTAAFTSTCYLAGPTLAVFFGGVIAVTLVLPVMVAMVEEMSGRVLVAAAACTGVAAAWLGALVCGWVSLAQWSVCVLLVIAFAIILSGIVAVLCHLQFEPVVAAACAVVLSLLWLSWPIWLSPAMAGRQGLVNWLVPAHPLLAINGELSNLGIWTERPLMYRWTALGQDVSYAMPNSVWWCVMVHAAIGAILILACALSSRTFRSGSNQEEIPSRPSTKSQINSNIQ